MSLLSFTPNPLAWAVSIALAWGAVGLAGLAAPRNVGYVGRVLFPIGAVLAVGLAVVALSALGGAPQSVVLPIGLPQLPFHLRIDALSAFFLLLIGAVGAGISIYAAGYFRPGEGTPAGLQCLLYHVFLASMALVVMADDGYSFMVAWETMALSSFFLVTSDHRHAEVRRAGYLYLLVAHVGAIAILLAFGILQNGTGDYAFANMRAQHHGGAWAAAAFFLALFGFGAKAGLLPLHIWLPEAHPAAPSPVSAMMSGVMLKTAVYGFLRVAFDLLHATVWWWGVVVLAFGLSTALYGVIFSAVQSDMKRLLAYSSIENIGILFVGIGLAIVFHGFDMKVLAALAMTAALYHCLSHASFKSLLFLCTGAVLHATHERSLGKLGGLIHRMPWVAWLALIGVIASAGLPPLNGFVSEWLLLQSFLFTPQLPHGYIHMFMPLAAAGVVLTAALAGYVMVKFFGVIFLGQPREEKLDEARDAGTLERIGLVWLASLCVTLGLFPVQVIGMIDSATTLLVGRGLGKALDTRAWWLLAPISADRASYSPALFLIVIAIALALGFLGVRAFYHHRTRQGPPWGCGFPLLNPRMQDTAEGFGQPIREIFQPFFRMRRELPSPFDAQPRYRVTVEDHLWYWLYLPIAKAAEFGTRLVTPLQQGRIGIYLLYSFCTLLLLLMFVR